MKTPREIILAQHRSAEDKLAAIRPEELAALARSSASNKKDQIATSDRVKNLNQNGFARSIAVLITEFWRQSIYPWRRIWAGIAAAWLGILALNAGFGQSSHSTIAQSASANPQVMAVLHEQKILLTQLLGPMAQPAIVRSTLPSPRSEQRHELFIG